MVDHGQGHLEQEKEKLMVKLKAVEVKMKEGERLHQKLIEILANCEKMQQLHQTQQSLLLLSTLLAAFHRLKEIVSLPVVSNLDSSSAAI